MSDHFPLPALPTPPDPAGDGDWGEVINAAFVEAFAAINQVYSLAATSASGLSAYQIWLNNGHTGTEADFLASLKGADGANGTAIAIKGTVANTGLLPATGNTVGDSYLISGVLWVCTALPNTWTNVGSIQGPQGVQGPQGPAGPAGQAAWGNVVVIDGPTAATAARANPIDGSPVPAGGRVIWISSTQPVNMLSTDQWYTPEAGN